MNVAIIAIIGVVGFLILNKFDPVGKIFNNDNQTQDTSNAVTTGKQNVKIDGEVNSPGTYSIEATCTLQDLINMANGVTENADPNSYIPDLVIENRKSFYIPSKITIPPNCVVENDKKVNINTASRTELMEIGFKSNQADELIKYRQEHGNFRCIEDIELVSGIGETTLYNLRNLITIK